VTALWIIFRARSMAELWNIMTVMASSIPSQVSTGMAVACGIMVWAWAAQILTENIDLKKRFLVLPIPLKIIPYLAVAALVLIFSSETPKSFIYFQF